MNDAAVARTPARGQGPAAPRLALYYALLVTESVSLIGSQISEYAVSIAVFRATGHATPLALVTFCSACPAVLLGGFAGALADRLDRRSEPENGHELQTRVVSHRHNERLFSQADRDSDEGRQIGRRRSAHADRSRCS